MKRRGPVTFEAKREAVRSSFTTALGVAAYLGADDPLMPLASIGSLGSWRGFCERVVLPLEERIYGVNDDDADPELQRLIAEFRKANVAALVAMMGMMYRRIELAE